MRTLLLFAMLSMSADFAIAQEKSLLEKHPDGWLDLTPGPKLEGWKRVPLAPDTKLIAKNAWSVKDGLLICDGVGVKEMFVHEKPFGDGVFHVEWRFRPVTEGKTDYNSGVYIRSKADGVHWHQVQVAHVEKPPFMGDIFGDIPSDGKLERVIIRGDGLKRIHPPGQWNTYEIAAKGKTISVWINGATTCVWKNCPNLVGHLGLQAEFFHLEFRNLKFKATP